MHVQDGLIILAYCLLMFFLMPALIMGSGAVCVWFFGDRKDYDWEPIWGHVILYGGLSVLAGILLLFKYAQGCNLDKAICP